MSEQQPDPDVDGTAGTDTDDTHLDPTNPDSDPDGINPSHPHPSEANRPNDAESTEPTEDGRDPSLDNPE